MNNQNSKAEQSRTFRLGKKSGTLIENCSFVFHYLGVLVKAFFLSVAYIFKIYEKQDTHACSNFQFLPMMFCITCTKATDADNTSWYIMKIYCSSFSL